MTQQPQIDLLDERYHAQDVANYAISAYWSDINRQCLTEAAHNSFVQLADVMGYTVTRKGGGEE